MEEDLSHTSGCQSLFCEELGIEDSQERKETSEAEEVKDDEDGEKEDEASQGAPQEEEDTKKVNKADHGGFQQKNRKRTRTKKTTEHRENIKEEKDVVEDKPEAVLMSPEANSALTEPPVGLITTRDLSEPVYLGCDGSDLDGPPAPVPMVQLSQNPGPVQLAPTKRSPGHSLPQTMSQQALEPLEMAITRVYSTRHSIHYSTRGHTESCLVAPKKKTRTFYSTDKLERLEALFQRDHYPDAEKRKVIAASVGVTPQRIMVWFQNRRAKWRKAERLVSCKYEQHQSRARWSPTHPQVHLALPNMPAAASSNVGLVFSGHVGAMIPPLEPVPPFSTMSTHSLPSCSQMLLTSPGQSRVSEQPNFQPRPMQSPPPLRRASLPLLSYNLNTPTPTPPLFMDDRDSHPLQTDASSLFDFGDKLDYLAPGHQSNPQLSFQLQTSYPPGQSQPLQTSSSLPPRMPFPTPSPYLTPNPDTISTSYFLFGHAGNSTAGHNYVQSQGGGPILLQPPNHGGMASYQSYPWPNMYAQPSVRQLAPNYTAGFAGARDLQIPSTSGNMPQCFPCAHGHGGPIILPPVSTLQPSRLRAESGMGAKGMAVAPLFPSQASPGSPRSAAAPSCDKVENDSPRAIHSHFQCDFSPIQF
ncbi:homeobox protein NOBOX [Hippocampus comes]|uniref:NOBOX oogenesis homeobox n=1 Tax=Hippocampus comes TaxID=109280 RepID=A0A3Q3D643_HIPCM|nr:PREDICTED: homeobox protein NOBOX [Hippocampus comes]XP_019729756.1 PREDICTED: homeobox protein NOBOX [Hippocampus comes]